MFKLLVYLCIILPVCSLAQNKAPLLIKDLINPDQIKETFTYSGNNIIVITPDSKDGKKIIRAFHTPLNPNFKNDKHYDNDILDYYTLQPLEKHRANGSVYYDYSEKGKIKTTFISLKDTIKKEISISKPVYNLQGPAAPALAWTLPLKVGLKTEFSVLTSGFPYKEGSYDSKIGDYTLEVIGEEKIIFNNKSIDTYIVEINSKTETGIYFKSWITKQSPHVCLQLIYTNDKTDLEYKTRKPHTFRNFFRGT